jgi:hypothetical protein
MVRWNYKITVHPEMAKTKNGVCTPRMVYAGIGEDG